MYVCMYVCIYVYAIGVINNSTTDLYDQSNFMKANLKCGNSLSRCIMSQLVLIVLALDGKCLGVFVIVFLR